MTAVTLPAVPEAGASGEKGNKPAGRHEGGSGKRDLPHAT